MTAHEERMRLELDGIILAHIAIRHPSPALEANLRSLLKVRRDLDAKSECQNAVFHANRAEGIEDYTSRCMACEGPTPEDDLGVR